MDTIDDSLYSTARKDLILHDMPIKDYGTDIACINMFSQSVNMLWQQKWDENLMGE